MAENLNPPDTLIPSIQKTEYEITPTTIYIGTAPLGTATNAASWRIQRITFVAGLPVEKMWTTAPAAWTNRAAAGYS